MSLESVAADIREQAHAEAEEIREAAEAEANAIIEEAEADAEEILEQRRQEIEQQIDQEREQRLSSANLEAKQMRLQARRSALEDVHTAVEDRLVTMEGDKRRELTDSLLEAALDEYDPDEPLVVHGREDDQALLESLIADHDQLSIGEPVDRLGGVIVEGTTTPMRVDNSFDAVLDSVWDRNLRSISDRLFEE